MLENEEHQLNDNELAERALLKKVEDNKAKIMMGLAYLNQYYGFKYGELSIKDIMMFKPDFYGKDTKCIRSFDSNWVKRAFLKKVTVHKMLTKK